MKEKIITEEEYIDALSYNLDIAYSLEHALELTHSYFKKEYGRDTELIFPILTEESKNKIFKWLDEIIEEDPSFEPYYKSSL